MSVEQARYKHDCENCVFLGYEDYYDLYFCPQGTIPTVIARFSNDGPDYISGMPFPYQKLGPLVKAKGLAKSKGLISE